MSFASHDLSSEIHPHEKVTKRSILLNKRPDDGPGERCQNTFRRGNIICSERVRY